MELRGYDPKPFLLAGKNAAVNDSVAYHVKAALPADHWPKIK